VSWKAILYDWGGLNAALFEAVNHGTPPSLAPFAWLFSSLLGNYWTAPLLILGLWRWSSARGEAPRAALGRRQLGRRQLRGLVAAFALALAIATFLKLLFDLPRPLALYGETVRVIGAAEWRYSLPSGHSLYAILAAGALWPLAGARSRIGLALYVVLVGWSRIASGMHFPADVLAAWIIGLGCLALASRLEVWLLPCATTIAPLAAHHWYAVAGVVAWIDQASKSVIVHEFAYGEVLPVNARFNLVHIGNTGAAFSLLAGASGWQRYAFIVLALGVSAWLSWMLRSAVPPLAKLGYSLILGGALGNAADRVVRGMVVDFLDFHWGTVHWPAFNTADVAISMGAVCLIFNALTQRTS